jgi:formylglycine-generating enzyme required for sulfatase activity
MLMQNSVRSFWLPLWAALVWLTPPASAVTIDWANVGGAGNAADDTGFGSVASGYAISKYEITNAQYRDFLNAVADTDTNGLYNANMGSSPDGITQLGISGGFSYQILIPGREDMPVNYVSFYDALRFANWLDNGQPTGAQGPSTTEDGAYTFSGATAVGSRNGTATIVLTSEDEWYKAAYYDAVTTTYFDYPAGSNTQTSCTTPGATANTANCLNAVGDLTDVGSYTGSASPNGTFDQGGNVWEWTEALIASGGFRVQRGGAYGFVPGNLEASIQRLGTPTDEVDFVGFRVAQVPEPDTALLLMTGMLTLAGWGRRRA